MLAVSKGSEEEPCVELPKPVAPIEICELEVCVEDLYRTANNNLTTARDACKVFNDIVKETMLNFEYMKLKALQKEMDDRRDLVKSTVKDGTIAKGQMDELGRFIDCKGAIGPEKVVTNVRDNIDDYDAILKRIKEEFLWENDRSAAIDGQWKLVEKDLEDYIEQIQSYYPTLTYADKKMSIANEDLDFLLIHSLKKERDAVPRVQWEADKLDDRTTRAFCDLESKDDKELLNREKKLDKEITKGMGTLDREYSARTKYVNEKNKKTRKAELAAQKKRQEEETKIVMEKKEKELQAKFKRRVADQVALEKLKMRTQLNDMKAKVDIVERKLKARLKAEENIKRSKALHKAGSDLLAATKKGEPYVCVLKELRAIEKASGKNDKLVNSVLNSIPDEVWQNGIVPESALKQRYSSMEDVAAKVALIEGDGAPLPIYVLSWMQYMLLFMKPKTIPQDEIDHPPKKPNRDLDTFDRLQRARYYVNDGNIKAALPYVDTLEGASRAAAAAWHDAARGYVETKQAAEAIMAHASAMGLQYV